MTCKRSVGIALLVGALLVAVPVGTALAGWTQESSSTKVDSSPTDGDLVGHVGHVDNYKSGIRQHYGKYNSFASGHSFGPGPKSKIGDNHRNTIKVCWKSSSAGDGYKLLRWSVLCRSHGQGQSSVTNGATFHLDHWVWIETIKVTAYDNGGSTQVHYENYKDQTKNHQQLDGIGNWNIPQGSYQLVHEDINVLGVPGCSPAVELEVESFQDVYAEGNHPAGVSSYWAVYSELTLEAIAYLGEN